jgi:hypothetical protein
MEEFTTYHAKSFAKEDWEMIVCHKNSAYHIAIINIKEQIFAKTFRSISYTDIQNVLSLNGYRISFSIDDVEGIKTLGLPTPLLLVIHNSQIIGNCQNFQSDIQKNQSDIKKNQSVDYLQPCPYCDKMNDKMKSNI